MPAQQPPPSDPSEQPSIITSSSQEVFLDLIIRDKRGRPVRDLKPGDIEILDDNAPVQLRSLRMSGESEVSPQVAMLDPMREVRLISLVFDNLNLDANRIARLGALDLVKAATNQRTYIGVFTIGKGLRLVQQYTTDKEKLKQAIQKATTIGKSRSNHESSQTDNALRGLASTPQQEAQLKAGDSSSLDERGPGQTLARFATAVMISSEEMSRDQKGRPSLSGLLALAQQQGELPGRKSIVYFCDGMQITGGLSEQFKSLVSSANKSNVSIYPVDARGLVITPWNKASADILGGGMLPSASGTSTIPSAGSAAGPSGGVAAGMNQVKSDELREMALMGNTQNPLYDLAASTGGFVTAETNDLRKPMQKLMEEVQTYYEATYQPANTTLDGRFHVITVKSNRKDIRIQARNGYFAVPSTGGSPVSPFELPMLKALADAKTESVLPVRASVVSLRPRPRGMGRGLVVELPLSAVLPEEEPTSKSFKMHLSVLALIRDAKGEVMQKFSQDIPYQGAIERMESIRKSELIFQKDFAVPPGKYTSEVVVYDRGANKMGVLRSPFTVEPVPAAGPGLSNLMLVRRLDPLREGISDDEFRYGKAKVVPYVQPVVRENWKQASFYMVVYPAPGQSQPPRLDLAVAREGEQGDLTEMPLPSESADGKLPFVASISTENLLPGRYIAKAVVTQGGVRREEQLPFEVEGTPTRVASIGGAAPARIQGNDTESLVPVATAATESGGRVKPVPAGIALNKPSEEEIARLLEQVQERSLGYASRLPNFLCMQTTRRSIDASGLGAWQQKDVVDEQLTYSAGREEYKVLGLNGQKTKLQHAQLRGTVSTGEFGSLLRIIFKPEAKAEFKWQDWSMVQGERTHVIAFRVPKERSGYYLSTSLPRFWEVPTTIRGLLYIDESNLAVRRITLEAEDIPEKFPIRQSSIALDYDWYRVGSTEFLLPSAATVVIRQGRRRTTKNDIEFRDYHKFVTASTLKF